MAATFNNPNSEIPENIMTPGIANVTYFFDISNGGKLSYMTPDRVVHVVIDNDASCCACEIAKSISQAFACGLENGTITPEQFNTFVAAGMAVEATESEADGVKTCTVVISQPVAP